MTLSIQMGEPRIISHEAVREPQLYKLRSGDLLLTYHVQTDKHFAERHGLRSRDGGRTWQAEPRRAHREQAMGEDDNGLVLACDIYTFERTPGEFIGSYFRSDDGGATFTGPHETRIFVDGVITQTYPTPPHFPADGHLLRSFYQPLPCYYEPIVRSASMHRGPAFWRYLVAQNGQWLTPMYCKFHGDRVSRTILVASEDEGRTWHYRSTVAYRHDEPRDGFCEPVLVTLPDASLLCVIRRGGNQPLAQCRSFDGGFTWTEPELLPGHGVDPDLAVMSSGVLACTYGRPGLHIMFSEDGHGFGWGYRTVVGQWPESSSYMAIAEVAPDELLLVYDRRETGADRHDPAACHVGCTSVHVSRTADSRGHEERTGVADVR